MAAKRWQLDPNANLNLDAGEGPGWGSIFIAPEDMIVDGTAPATLTRDAGTDGQAQYSTLGFAGGTADDLAFWNGIMPADYVPGGKIELDLNFQINSNTSNVRWDGQAKSWKSDGTVVMDAALTGLTGVSVAVPGTAYFVTKGTLVICDGAGAPITSRPGYNISIMVFRDQGHTDDVNSNDALLLGMRLRYERS